MKYEIKLNETEKEKLFKIYNLYKNDTNSPQETINFCINFTYRAIYEDN